MKKNRHDLMRQERRCPFYISIFGFNMTTSFFTPQPSFSTRRGGFVYKYNLQDAYLSSKKVIPPYNTRRLLYVFGGSL
jgi:hypothetical protein